MRRILCVCGGGGRAGGGVSEKSGVLCSSTCHPHINLKEVITQTQHAGKLGSKTTIVTASQQICSRGNNQCILRPEDSLTANPNYNGQ